MLSQDVLTRAGIEEADGLAAVTNSDSVNAVVGHMARDGLQGAATWWSRNYDPRWLPMHEAFGLQVVSSTAWGAQRIEELLYQPLGATVFSAGNGEVEVYELVVPRGLAGAATGRAPGRARSAMAVALTRAGRSVLPAPDLVLDAGRHAARERHPARHRGAARARGAREDPLMAEALACSC